MNSDQKPDSLKTQDGEAQHQTTMTFTGKSNVLNNKTQKYMFWIQKNKHLFSSYNVILKIHKERYPFVNSKSKAACVLHEEDFGYRVTLDS